MLSIFNLNLWNVINLISSYIEWILFFVVIRESSRRKVSCSKLYIFFLAIMIFIGYINLTSVFQNTKIILCIVISFIYYKLSYNENLSKCILITLLFWLSTMAIEALSIGLVLFTNNLDNINILINENIYRLEAIIISKILLIIEFILFKYFKLSLEFKPKDVLLIGIPISSNILCLLLIFGYNIRANIENRTNAVFLGISSILLVLSTIILLIVIGKIIQDDKIKLENELINERNQMSYKNYENLNEAHNRIRYIYHDLRNHMICLKSYDCRSDMIKYIDNLNLEINKFSRVIKTGNNTLDIILSEKIYECSKYNIMFESNINCTKLDFISDIDICSIFANALDNSIEACKKIDENIEKKIQLKVTYVNKFCIIKLINTKKNKIKFTPMGMETSKRDKFKHGIGLASIKRTVNKYNGDVIINYSDDEFILKIMIPIKD
ncbi:sensor histidine kinase virs; sensor histidine kinase virs (plasmid) [[Clostridium] sordellii]|uniref:ATP-binding protein n=1 Tax=Paraclostridium sordellii TaxID=1505 RepID=UPI0005411012|nr:ATP-binding protein [Paeniclostridium sordellii]CEK36647.1 sensor histidine kinase virs; sensor histidine kinase virs (plasmid) [[Clostridium] sordellii] [Paeniclostridium sordellii]